MRLALLLIALFVGACAPTAPTSTPADWALLADALGSEEYAETFMDELNTRLHAIDAGLTDRQEETVFQALVSGVEAQRMVIYRYRDAPDQTAEAGRQLQALNTSTDTVVEALLDPAQVPVYRALQVEVRAALAREAAGQ